jgi:hypothetical protein
MKAELQEIFAHPVVAAAAGALVGLRALPGTSYIEKLANVSCGFAIAAWGGPALVDWLVITSPRVASGMIFICGATGLVVANALWEAIKRTDFAAWIMSWLPKRGG